MTKEQVMDCLKAEHLTEKEREVLQIVLQKPGVTKDVLAKGLGLSIKTIENKISNIRRRIQDRYPLINIQKRNGEIAYFISPKVEPFWVKYKEPFFKQYVDKNTPYTVINFPDVLSGDTSESLRKGEKIIIAPIADLHYGSIDFNERMFDEYIAWISATEHVFVFILGDMIELATKTSIADGVFKQKLDPQRQINDVVKMLAPIRHRILWISRGNHERRSVNAVGVDPMEMISQLLHIPYIRGQVYADVTWRGNQWSIHSWHGRSVALTEGGKLNSAMSPLGFTDFTHFYVTAHVHDATVRRKDIIIADRERQTLVKKKRYICICGSFLNYFGSYGEEKAYPPPIDGTISLRLYANGDYHATS